MGSSYLRADPRREGIRTTHSHGADSAASTVRVVPTSLVIARIGKGADLLVVRAQSAKARADTGGRARRSARSVDAQTSYPATGRARDVVWPRLACAGDTRFAGQAIGTVWLWLRLWFWLGLLPLLSLLPSTLARRVLSELERQRPSQSKHDQPARGHRGNLRDATTVNAPGFYKTLRHVLRRSTNAANRAFAFLARQVWRSRRRGRRRGWTWAVGAAYLRSRRAVSSAACRR